jgi:hypothetical protein
VLVEQNIRKASVMTAIIIGLTALALFDFFFEQKAEAIKK